MNLMKMIEDKTVQFQRAKSVNAPNLIWLTIAFAIGVVFFIFTTDQNLPVMLPLTAATGSALFFFWVLWHQRRGGVPFFEIGAVYVAVVSLYTLYPLTGFILNGLNYTPFNDARLFLAQPAPQEIGLVGWYHVVHLVSFVVVYTLVRRRLPREQTRVLKFDRVIPLIAVLFYVAISAFFLFLGLFYNLSASTYLESYLVYQRLPLILAQFAGHLGGTRLTLELVILAALFSNYRKYRLLIMSWLVLVMLVTFLRLESRTELVLLILSAATMYQHLVKPVSLWVIIVVGLLGLSLFILLGLMRSGLSLSQLTSGYNPFTSSSEFETIFANAYDLNRLKAMRMISDLPPTFYLSDFLALVPQQFIPFAKISPSIWYLNTYYPEFAAAGGGLAFGTISESVLGGGWIDLAGRGAVLGFILAQVHRYYTFRSSFWAFIFYVWMTVLVYQLFRNTTFYLLVLFFYRFLPVMLGGKLLSFILRGSVRHHRYPSPGT